jgi:hypothetical protein
MLSLRPAAVVALAAALLGACASSHRHAASTASSTTAAVAASGAAGTTTTAARPSTCGPSTTAAGGTTGGTDATPPGDIPDNQAFVVFSPATGHYEIKVPEGWARTDASSAVTFTDKFNAIRVELVPAAAMPTPASAQATEVPTIAAAAPCFEPGSVTAVTRTAGSSVRITYRADAAPDPVTGKVVHDDVERYEFWQAGTEAVITLSAPMGSDNKDPWLTITNAFRWK